MAKVLKTAYSLLHFVGGKDLPYFPVSSAFQISYIRVGGGIFDVVLYIFEGDFY